MTVNSIWIKVKNGFPDKFVFALSWLGCVVLYFCGVILYILLKTPSLPFYQLASGVFAIIMTLWSFYYLLTEKPEDQRKS